MPPTSEKDIYATARYPEADRLKRFAQYVERLQRGETVRSYDTRWLDYLKEHRIEPRQRRRKLG
jgi:hypothetical protein